MEPSLRRVRVVCVARNTIKAQFLMSVASVSTVPRALAPPSAAAQLRLRSFSLGLLWAPPRCRSPLTAAPCRGRR